MQKLALRLALAIAALTLTAGTARAATATATLDVTATVVPSCTIAATPVAFGNYDPLVTNSSTALNAQGTVTVTCTTGTAYTIGLGAGNSASGSRAMQHASLTAELPYELYLDAARTTVWDNTVMQTGTAAGITPAPYPVYGRIPAAQNVPTGSYADAVVATVTF
ncbi:Spore coat U domain protein [Anaeromyxobacter dehalogenans 2CP-1]|uniref:Spore coat U domain protein n=1 Tax=Anaeromyxobacter dehalogenans (strain ATCC BAA-258 / DSM 21875 / 2CP-1) TaxID=455488 RepID=B8J6U7_ANAD2|nr:spore coat U domain-containing protein [Anaeromyxobacter dehalogenans]ACL67069.1 Spore coat U domain protein [Anaeromyxobacter dehalogenans 2CP-1]